MTGIRFVYFLFDFVFQRSMGFVFVVVFFWGGRGTGKGGGERACASFVPLSNKGTKASLISFIKNFR